MLGSPIAISELGKINLAAREEFSHWRRFQTNHKIITYFSYQTLIRFITPTVYYQMYCALLSAPRIVFKANTHSLWSKDSVRLSPRCHGLPELDGVSLLTGSKPISFGEDVTKFDVACWVWAQAAALKQPRMGCDGKCEAAAPSMDTGISGGNGCAVCQVMYDSQRDTLWNTRRIDAPDVRQTHNAYPK